MQMRASRKSYAILIAALTLIMLSGTFAEQTTNNATPQQQTKQLQMQPLANAIVLANNVWGFHRYNTNGTVSNVVGDSATFFGGNTTDMYSDMVSYRSINANKTLILHADLSVDINNFSNTAEDQFAVFATDDITKYKSDEFGFLVPENSATLYAYVQSPQIPDFFIWKPLVETNHMEPHSYQAVYNNENATQYVDFFVDGQLVWSTNYPDISGNNFHMVLTSHKVSSEVIDLSRNMMVAENASLAG
jgi:hypothetical protein